MLNLDNPYANGFERFGGIFFKRNSAVSLN